MKTTKRILSFLIVVCMAFIGLFNMPMVKADAADGTWTLVKDVNDLAVGDQVIIVAKDSAVAMSTTQNSNNRGQVAVTKSGDTLTYTTAVQVLTLQAGKTTGTFAFYTGSGYLYAASSSKNYLRTESSLTTNSSWKITIATTGVATVKATGSYTRNLMQYNKGSSIFSAYSSAQQSLVIYKLVAAPELDDTATKEALNDVSASMSLAYSYTQTSKTVEKPATVTDKLTSSTTGVTGTSYTSWTGKKATSSAVYAGTSTTQNSAIQLNNNDKKPGVVTTASAGKVVKVIVEWNSSTNDGRTLNIFAKNTAYTGAADLFNTSAQGTKIGTIVKGTSTELEINGDYAYIGFTSNASAMYLTSVEIVWDTGAGTTTEVVKEFSNSNFYLRCGVDASLSEIANVDSYGIKVTANDKPVSYAEGQANSTSWNNDGEMMYVVLNLGDVLNKDNLSKATTEFTVVAYVKVGNQEYVSEKVKKLSVVDMVKAYYEKGITEVEHLYNYFVEMELI